MKWNDILPLGSIVLLKDSEPRFRIQVIGYAQVKADDLKIFDYAGVLYAKGFWDKESVFLFNHEDIEKIYAIGYLDDDMRKHISYVKTLIDDIRSKKADINQIIEESEARFGKVII